MGDRGPVYSTGVVDQNIESAIDLYGLGDEVLNAGVISNIDGDGSGNATKAMNFADYGVDG